MIDDDHAIIAEFLESLGPVDPSKRPPNWPTRSDISLNFPAKPGEKLGLCVSIRLNEAQADLIRQAAAAAGVGPGQWAQRHMLAAVGCLPINSPVDAPILQQIRETAAFLDALLVAAKQ